MNKKLVNQAAKKLELIDITLAEQSLSTSEDDYYFGQFRTEEYVQQDMLNVNTMQFTYAAEDRELNTLTVHVRLGVRLVQFASPSDAEADPSDIKRILAEIKACFRAEYLFTGSPPPVEAIEEFANFNAVHNVFPFWREVVFSLARSARLPQILVPMYRNAAPIEAAGNVETSGSKVASAKQKGRKRKSKRGQA